MVAKCSDSVEQAMVLTFATSNERQRRFFAATEALKLGHGGIGYVAQLLGCQRKTVERGLQDVRCSDSPLPSDRARKKGVAASAV